ncbi:ATP-dependent Clp protease adapter ClpS [Nocardia sp. BMG51109]
MDAVRVAAGPVGANVTATSAPAPEAAAGAATPHLGSVAVVKLSAPQATPEAVEYTEILEAEDRPWVTVVWDDPVNLMHYVTYIFQKLFGYSKAKATELMLKVHNEGKAVVSSGSRDKMEHDVQRLHAAGLWATMQRDD